MTRRIHNRIQGAFITVVECPGLSLGEGGASPFWAGLFPHLRVRPGGGEAVQSRMSQQPIHRLSRTHATSLAPLPELDGVTPPISSLTTVQNREVEAQTLREYPLSKPRIVAHFAQHDGQSPVGELVLGAWASACCHRSSTLSCRVLVARSATG